MALASAALGFRMANVLSFQGCGLAEWLANVFLFSCGPRLFIQSGTGRPRRGVCAYVRACVCVTAGKLKHDTHVLYILSSVQLMSDVFLSWCNFCCMCVCS